MQEIEVTVIEDTVTDTCFSQRETLTNSYLFVDCQDIGGESALVQAAKFAKRQVRKSTAVLLMDENSEVIFNSKRFNKLPEAKAFLTQMTKGV